jgi:hypothetical protein
MQNLKVLHTHSALLLRNRHRIGRPLPLLSPHGPVWSLITWIGGGLLCIPLHDAWVDGYSAAEYEAHVKLGRRALA